MESQVPRVRASLIATAAHDMNGVRHRHPTESDRLRAENAGLRVELALARDSRAAAIESYLLLREARAA